METRTFNTREEAAEFIGKVNKGIYELCYGEYARPDYRVRKIRNKNLYGVYVNYYFYPGTFNAKKDGFLTWEETYYI